MKIFFTGEAFESFLIRMQIVQLFAVDFDLLLVMLDFLFQATNLFIVCITLVQTAIAHYECQAKNTMVTSQ